ncbi:MAG: hypothetical protein ACLP9C_04585 [Acidimicrobiales bacterium]
MPGEDQAPLGVVPPVPPVPAAPSDPAAPPGERAGPGRRVAVGVAANLGVLAVFCLPGLALWWHAWDGHLATTLACACGDSGQQVWFIAWPAYAIEHGLNPFFSGALWAPDGVNLLSNASSPLVGIALAPVTWLAGPIVTTNLALVLAPALSAWGCWFACRRMVGWAPAAWIAGAVFGYSPFIVDNDATGHVGLALLVVPPLMMLVSYRLLTGRSSPVRGGIALGLLAVAQFFISSEVLVVTAVVGVAALGATALFAPGRLAATWREAGTALVTAGGVVVAGLALPVWFTLAGPQHIAGSPWPGIQIEGNRLVDIVKAGPSGLPSSYLQLGGYEGPAGPPGAYLGLALVALAVAAAVVAWRRRTTRILAATALAAVVCSLGAVLWTGGTSLHGRLWLPWKFLGSLPILDKVGPQRFTALADLLVATVLALGLDACWLATRRWRSSPEPGSGPDRHRAMTAGIAGALVAVSVAAVASVWVTYHAPLTTRRVSQPGWVRSVARAPVPGSATPVVLVYPFSMSATFNAGPLVVQAMSSMSFDLVGGYAKVPGPGGGALVLGPARSPEHLLATLSLGPGPLPAPAPWQIGVLRDEVASTGTSLVVVTDAGRSPSYAAELFTAALGRAPSTASGAWAWRVPATSGGPGAPPTRTPALAVAALGNCRTLVGPAADRWPGVAAVDRCIVSQERA